MRTRAIIDDLLQDLRYAVRTLRRDAGLTTFAVLIVVLLVRPQGLFSQLSTQRAVVG